MKRRMTLRLVLATIMVVAITTLTVACGTESPRIQDTTAPMVSFTIPVNTGTDVPVNSKIFATFSEGMESLTITTSTFTLKQGSTPVSGTVSFTGVTATFTPDGDLSAGTVYTATIAAMVADREGNPLAEAKVWTFTTGVAPDITAPMVSSIVPVNIATGVPVNSAMTATFSEGMDPLTITTSTFTLKQGSTPVSGTVTYAGIIATFTPDNDLSAGTAYTAMITTGAKDLASNALASNYTWSFTTYSSGGGGGAYVDTTAPRVSSVFPVNNAVGVPVNSAMAVTFSEAMNPLTLTTVTFTLKQGSTPVSGTVTYAGVTATFTPDNDLSAGIEYTAMITTGAKDLANNALASNYTWSFATYSGGGGGGGGGGGSYSDSTRPTVDSVIPVDDAINVVINTNVVVTFSETVAPLTVTIATFNLTQGGTEVLGSVTPSGITATFNPNVDLAPGTIYTATITTGVTDLAGNPLAANYVWSFNTSAAADTTAPEVVLTFPNASTGCLANTSNITANFSEWMDPLTITTATFNLTQGGTPVDGAVTLTPNGIMATFNPDADLSSDTTYIATITTGATDLAGNPLAANYVWSFTTCDAALAPGAAPLGLAGTYGIMASSAITDASHASYIWGDVALYPGTSCGLLPAQVSGTIHTASDGDGVAAAAYTDLTTAYHFCKDLPPGTTVSPGEDLGAKIVGSNPPGRLPPGTYTSGSTMYINTPVVLDAGGNADAVWVFQIGSSLTTVAGAPGGDVTLANGAQQKNVFFVPTEAASIGSGTTFYGNILAGGDLSVEGDATIYGRLLAGAIGACTLALNGEASTVYVPAP